MHQHARLDRNHPKFPMDSVLGFVSFLMYVETKPKSQQAQAILKAKYLIKFQEFWFLIYFRTIQSNKTIECKQIITMTYKL